MNKSKKLLQPEYNSMNKKKVNKERKFPIKAIVLIATLFFVMSAVLIGYDMLHKEVIVSVGEKNFYLKDMMYQVYNTETTNESTSQLYRSFYGEEFDYWGQNNNGVSTKEQARNETMSNVIYYEIMYNEAVKKGITVTDAEKATVQTTIDALLKDMPKKRKQLTGFTKENLTPILEQKTLVDRYYKDLIEAYDIDDEAITAEFKLEEYRQYDIEYLVRSTQIDDNGDNVTDMTDADKKTIKAKLATYFEKAKDGEALDKLISEEDTKKNYTYSTGSFIEGNEEKALDEAIMAAALPLKNGEVADKIIETEQGFYIIKMVNNNSTAAYDEAVKNAISDAELTAFEADYTKMKELYEIKINNKAWAKVEFGSITLTPGASLTTATAEPTATTEPTTTKEAGATTEPTATEEAAATTEPTTKK